jgi:hypothetical protein
MSDDRPRSPEAAQFEIVLDELRGLLADFTTIGVGAMLIGGQVLALEGKAAGGDGVIEVRTPTDVVIQRGFSMEPDLLFDVDEAAPRVDAIVDILKRRHFKRVTTYRWAKATAAGDVLLDLFMPPDADDANNPAGFTRLPKGDVALLRPRTVQVRLASGVLSVAVPDPVGFLAMKLEAKLRLRPTATKDAFDIYAYVTMKGASVVRSALRSDLVDGPCILQHLTVLFGAVDAAGVVDVLAYADTLGGDERALVARAVVDLFEDVTAA